MAFYQDAQAWAQNDETAAKKFQEAGKAYDCLKDPKQRHIYDQVGLLKA